MDVIGTTGGRLGKVGAARALAACALATPIGLFAAAGDLPAPAGPT